MWDQGDADKINSSLYCKGSCINIIYVDGRMGYIKNDGKFLWLRMAGEWACSKTAMRIFHSFQLK